MAEIQRDQAEGLRRLFAHCAVRSIAFTGGEGAGKSSVILNLSTLFAKRGRRVLLLDETSGSGGSAAYLGLRPQWDLRHVMQRKRKLSEVALPGPAGMVLVPAGRAVTDPALVNEEDREQLAAAMSEWEADFVLVDSVAKISNLTLAAREIVVVVSGEANAITEAYSIIKELALEFARVRFHILVNRVKSRDDAGAVFENLSGVMRRFLKITPQYLGCIPLDQEMRRAARLRLPVVEMSRGSQSAVALGAVADLIEQWPYPEENCLGDFVQRLIGGRQYAATIPF